MQTRELYIKSDGMRLHCKLDYPPTRTQRMPLVIIVHGFTGHMEETHIAGVAAAVNEIGFAALRVDMFGHGGSDGRFEDHTLYKWISGLMDVIDYAEGLDFVSDLFLCGHSQGGLVVMLTAALEKGRIRGIIPLSPGISIPELAAKGEFLGTRFDPDHIPAEITTWKGLRLKGNYLRVAQAVDVGRAIRSYRGPVLLVHGSGDDAVPAYYSEEAARQYEFAELVIVPGDTHCYDYHLDLMLEAVCDFLQRMQ